MILKVGVPRLLGSMRDTNLRECLAGKVLGERSDPSRDPAFSLSSPTGVGHSGIFIAQATGPNSSDLPRTGDGVRQHDRRWPGVAKGRSSHGPGRSSPAIVPLPQELGDGDLDGARHRHGGQGARMPASSVPSRMAMITTSGDNLSARP
jgi:hypothetical protein